MNYVLLVYIILLPVVTASWVSKKVFAALMNNGKGWAWLGGIATFALCFTVFAGTMIVVFGAAFGR